MCAGNVMFLRLLCFLRSLKWQNKDLSHGQLSAALAKASAPPPLQCHGHVAVKERTLQSLSDLLRLKRSQPLPGMLLVFCQGLGRSEGTFSIHAMAKFLTVPGTGQNWQQRLQLSEEA